MTDQIESTQRSRRPTAELSPAIQARGTQTRELLLQAALTCFERHGVSGTNTTMISDMAGLTRGAYRHHFKSREMLIAAAIDYMQQKVMANIEQSIRLLFLAPDTETLFVDIWKTAMSDGFFAGYEMMLLSRHDAPLREEWLYHSRAFKTRREEILREMFDEQTAIEEAYPFLEGIADFYRGVKIMEVVRDEAETLRVINGMSPIFRQHLELLQRKLKAR